jgi:hypothetical protein
MKQLPYRLRYHNQKDLHHNDLRRNKQNIKQQHIPEISYPDFDLPAVEYNDQHQITQDGEILLFPTVKLMYLSRKFYSNPSSSSSQYAVRIRKPKIRIPNIKIPTQTEEEAMSEIGKFIDVRDSVLIHNLDETGFVYGVLSQLNPEKWERKKLEEKDDPMYYCNNKKLQANVNDTIKRP